MGILAFITNISHLLRNICTYKLALPHGSDNLISSWFYKVIFIYSKTDVITILVDWLIKMNETQKQTFDYLYNE